MASILFLVLGKSSLQGQELQFSVTLDKASYNKGEPIKCELTIKNISKKELVVNNRFLVNLPNGPHEVSLVITDPDHYPVFFTSLVRASFQSDEYVKLKPGGSTSASYTISNDFDFVKPGAYQVTGYYENKSEAPVSLHFPIAWKGSLTSAKSTFTIH